MSPENAKRVQEAVKEAGAHLDGKLLPHSFNNTRPRNAYAHLWERVATLMGRSYKLCDDNEVDKILEIIAWHRENPC